MASVQEAFLEASDAVSSGSLPDVPKDEALELYGLYSRVQKGECYGERPGMLQRVQQAKYDAWKGASEHTREEAMLLYVQLVQRLMGNRKPGSFAADEKRPLGFAIPDEEEREESETTLCDYAATDDLKSVRYCIERRQVPVDFVDGEGMTAMMRAADRNQERIIKYLIDRGADLNLADQDGLTALHYAVLCGHEQAVDLLVLHGADYTLGNADGETPWDLADEIIRQRILNSSQKQSRLATAPLAARMLKRIVLVVTIVAAVLLTVETRAHLRSQTTPETAK